MSVLLVFDKFGIDDAPALIVSADRIPEVREIIRERLQNSTREPDLRVRIPPEYRPRFADFIGLKGIECIFVEPRSEFAKRFGMAAPLWLTDTLIVTLGLLGTPAESYDAAEWLQDDTGLILHLLEPALILPESWQAFCNALRGTKIQTDNLLRLPEVQQRLARSAQAFLSSLGLANRFVEKVANAPSPDLALTQCGQQQMYEQLREFVALYEITYALPPRTEPTEFLNALPSLKISEEEAGGLIGDLHHLLDETLHAIEAGRAPAARLAELMMGDWPSVFTFLQDRFQDTRIPLASRELVAVLENYSSREARQFSELVYQQIISYQPLPESADIKAAKKWINGYLEYALRRFLLSQEPEESISGSFSTWVLQEKARIARSDLDWRRVANTIREQLKSPETRVIVCLVDALGAAHNSQILEILHQHLSKDELVLEGSYLIAPYPTLTEIGKNAVLTGKPAQETSGPIENRLFQAYRDSLPDTEAIHVIKSWNDRSEPIPKSIRLLVYLENRIDERLHGCCDYAKFNNDVEVIIKQLARELSRWISQSRKHGFDPVIIITADHGLSYIRAVESFKSADSMPESSGERCLTFVKESTAREDFAQVEAGSKNYLIPLRRVRLQGEIPLSHGGLTPEELLIPYIVLRKDCVAVPTGPLLQLLPTQCNALASKDGWQLELELQAFCPAQTIKVEAQPPFRGHAGPYGPLQKGETVKFTLSLATDCPQEGWIQVDVSMTFIRSELNHAKEQLYTKLSVNFPASFLEKDDQIAAFEDMF
jgi:hypothetical protein